MVAGGEGGNHSGSWSGSTSPGSGNAAGDLDFEFAGIMRRLQTAIRCAPRSIRVRAEQWSQRISILSSAPHGTFRRDRNLQAELLLKCVEDRCWTEPFDRHPPEGPLPMLPPHVSCALRHKRVGRLELPRVSQENFKGSLVLCKAPRGVLCASTDFVDTRDVLIEPRYELKSATTMKRSECGKAGCGAQDRHEVLDLTCSGQHEQIVSPTRWESAAIVPKSKDEQSFGIFMGDENTMIPHVMGSAKFKSYGDHELEDHSEHGLASAAANAMNQNACTPRDLVTGVSSPPAYALLSARIAHLQDENRRLRLQLGQEQRRSGFLEDQLAALMSKSRSCGRLRSMPLCRSKSGSRSSSPSVHQWDATHAGCSCAKIRSIARGETQNWQPSSGSPGPPNTQDRLPSPPGPPPPEGDTEGFLQYLDRFQDYAGYLCARSLSTQEHVERPLATRYVVRA